MRITNSIALNHFLDADNKHQVSDVEAEAGFFRAVSRWLVPNEKNLILANVTY